MMKRIAIVSILMALMAVSVSAQTKSKTNLKFSDIDGSLQLSEQMKDFSKQIQDMVKSTKKASDVSAVESVENELKGIDFRYDVFFQTHTYEISSHDGLLTLASDYVAERQALVDSLAAKRARFEAKGKFDEAAAFIAAQDSTYRRMYKMSVKYSMTSQTAKALEKLKAKEQMLFASVEENYSTALSSVDADKTLSEELSAVEDNYIELKSYSSKIQQAAYKPLVERVKDYLISIAAVTIVLMFLVMVQSRLSSIKQYRDSVRKMKEQMNLNNKNNDTPTI